jgi:hypothetical protein
VAVRPVGAQAMAFGAWNENSQLAFPIQADERIQDYIEAQSRMSGLTANSFNEMETTMMKPIVLWVAGVPIVGIVLLKVFGLI